MAAPHSCLVQAPTTHSTIAQEIAAEGLDSSLTRAYLQSRLGVSNLDVLVSHLTELSVVTSLCPMAALSVGAGVSELLCVAACFSSACTALSFCH